MDFQPDVGAGSNKPSSVTYNFIEKKSKDSSTLKFSRKYKSSTPYRKSKFQK